MNQRIILEICIICFMYGNASGVIYFTVHIELHLLNDFASRFLLLLYCRLKLLRRDLIHTKIR